MLTNILKISGKYNLILLIISLLGASIILFGAKNYGVGINIDSVGYISTARNIAFGIGAVNYDGFPLVEWPPLYPAILGAVNYVFGVDPVSSANILNAIFFGLTIYLSGILFYKHVTSNEILAIIGILSLLFAHVIIYVSLWIWSDSLFILLVVFYLISLIKYVENKKYSSLLLVSFSVALASLTRYIGVFLIVAGIISILLIRHDNLKTKFSHLLVFGVISVLPVSVWVIRNYFLTGTLFGLRDSSPYSLSDNITYTFDVIMRWYLPFRIVQSRPILMLISIFSGFLVGAVYVWENVTVKKLLNQNYLFPFLTFLVIIIYTGFLIISSSNIAYDRINNRLLSPVIVPTTLLLFFFIDKLSKQLKKRFSPKILNFILLIGIAIWLVHPVRETTRVIAYSLEGFGYNSEYWIESETIKFINDERFECTIYSNGIDAIYFFTGKNAIQVLKEIRYANQVTPLYMLRYEWPDEDIICIVWFDAITRNYLLTLEEFLLFYRIDKEIRLNDGAIYYLSKIMP
jgi:hypothetical protein